MGEQREAVALDMSFSGCVWIRTRNSRFMRYYYGAAVTMVRTSAFFVVSSPMPPKGSVPVYFC